MLRRAHISLMIAATLGLLAFPTPLRAASELDRDLERQLLGTWGVRVVEAYSDCGGRYNNNEVHGTNVASTADRRFEPGELVKVDKIKLKRARIDLSVDAHERRAPSDRRGDDDADRAWRDGYRDGQRLMRELLVADALRSCLLPPPASH